MDNTYLLLLTFCWIAAAIISGAYVGYHSYKTESFLGIGGTKRFHMPDNLKICHNNTRFCFKDSGEAVTLEQIKRYKRTGSFF